MEQYNNNNNNNKKMIKIAVSNVGGRIGRILVESLLKDENNNNIKLGSVLSEKNTTVHGLDVGKMLGLKNKLNLIIQDDINAEKNNFDVLIDFSYPKVSLKYLKFCRENNKKIVIGTTGFTETEKKYIYDAGKDTGIVFSANYSIGINVILVLLHIISNIIGKNSDINIIESHHKYKKDIPSGTSLIMKKVIESVLYKNDKKYNYNKKVLLSSLRAGDIIGEHTVMFCLSGERIEIIHRAMDIMIFIKGAIDSAIWIFNLNKNGIFDMKDVLNIFY